MKFGKYLAKRYLDLPEYAQYFLNYKALKKLIKRLAANSVSDSSAVARYARLQQNKSTFFFQLERELEKATNFYNQKEAELEVRLEQLVQRRKAIGSGALGKITRSSVAYVSLHESLLRFRRDLDRLEQFVELNATGFAKVLKKWDKQSRSETKELYLGRAVEVQPMFDRRILAALNDRSNALLLEIEALAQGDQLVIETVRDATPLLAQAEASDELFAEFVRFASEYDGRDAAARAAMTAWLDEFAHAESGVGVAQMGGIGSTLGSTLGSALGGSPGGGPGGSLNISNTISQIFLRSIPTRASDAALMAVWNSGRVDACAVDEVAGRTALHLCASFSSVPENDARVGGAQITRSAVFSAVLAAVLDSGSEANADASDAANAADASADSRMEESPAPQPAPHSALPPQVAAFINAKDLNGCTPLIGAATHDRDDFLAQLLAAGADPSVCDNDNLTALHYALFRGFLSCAEALLDAGARTSGLNTERQYVPLNFACQHGQLSGVAMLLRKRPKDAMVADAEGLFPLHIAARNGYADMVTLLCGAGANANQVDKLNAWTPLMYAAAEGHEKAVVALLAAHADARVVDERGRTALFYAAWEGHPSAFRVLLAEHEAEPTAGLTGVPTVVSAFSSLEEETEETAADSDDDIPDIPDIPDDDIPDLELPPPIMPLKRYGHNFLDAQKVIVQIRDIQVRFNKDRRGLRAASMTITSSSTQDSIPRNLALPVPAPDHVQTFEVDDFANLSLVFEVMPIFGTRLLSKAVAGPHVFGNGSDERELGRHSRTVQVTMLDLMLRPVGVLEFAFLVVRPFPGRVLDIAKYDTYWKSQQEMATLSYVTASSLKGSYERIVVTLTRDLVPVVTDMSVDIQGIRLPTPLLTLAELRHISGGGVQPLRDWWGAQPAETSVNIHVPFPTVIESRDVPVRWPSMNVYVDRILSVVFDHAREAQSRARGLVFSSTHPDICAMFNWKQPNYPVLFFVEAMRADGIYTTANRILTSESPLGELPVCKSLREASIFASNNNLMGIAAPAAILRLVPAVVLAIRAMGLVLLAADAEGPIDGVDGYQQGAEVAFSRDISM